MGFVRYEETLSHLFLSCDIVKDFWLWLGALLGLELQEDGVMLYMNNYTVLTESQFYLYAKGKQAIWSLRNKCVFQKTQPSLMLLKKIWSKLVKEGLETVHCVYKNRGKGQLFVEKYCNNVISLDIGIINFSFIL